MKFMVTGGAGFIGSHLVDALISQGNSVIVVDNLSTGQRYNINPAAKFYKVGITSTRLREIFAIERPDLVVHLACVGMSHSILDDPLPAFEANVMASLNLLEGARIYNTKKVIYASSFMVYGNNHSLPCAEDSTKTPLSHYTVYKLSVERFLQMYHLNYGLDYTVLRLPVVYGPRQRSNSHYAIVTSIISQALYNMPVEINGSQNQLHDVVYVDDVIMAFHQATKQGGGQIINIGSNQALSTEQLFKLITTAVKSQSLPHYSPNYSGYIHKMQLDISRAIQVLNWTPQIDITQGIKMTANYFTSAALHSR